MIPARGFITGNGFYHFQYTLKKKPGITTMAKKIKLIRVKVFMNFTPFSG